MALAILDGTQTATTLSTILSSGQHITAHTVVSLGTQAKTDILSAVSSGIAISGTVTANLGYSSIYDDGGDALKINISAYDGSNAQAVTDTNGLPVKILAGTVTVGNTVTIAGTVTANPTGTQTIAGSVTIGAGTAQIGSVTASISNSVTIGGGSVTIGAGTAQIGSVTASMFGVDITDPTIKRQPSLSSMSETFGDASSGYTLITKISSSSGNPINPLSNTELRATAVTIAGTVTVGNTVTIAGTVTANIAISSTAITSGSFTSLTSATLVPGNVARKMATVYNLGAGQLFVNAGATATTLGGGFMVALSSGDFYECDYTTTTLSAIFATAGTASWVSH